MLKLLICWFRGHSWKYDRHVWGSGLDPHDRFVCDRCGSDQLEPAGPVRSGIAEPAY